MGQGINMKLKVLGSSSKGNCYILQSPTGSLLIEAGVHFKEVQKELNYDLSSIVGCLITHEHKDHSKASKNIMKAGIDCYMSSGTCGSLSLEHWACNTYRLSFAKGGVQFQICDFNVLPFDIEHDAAEPLGFLIQYRPTGEKLLFITDSYYSKYQFRGLHYIMIECNYIKDILNQNIEDGYLDEHMKTRLLESHFSLENVKEFLKANDLSQCREIILLHLSEGNSDGTRMIQEIEDITGIKPKIAEPGLVVELVLYPY